MPTRNDNSSSAWVEMQQYSADGSGTASLHCKPHLFHLRLRVCLPVRVVQMPARSLTRCSQGRQRQVLLLVAAVAGTGRLQSPLPLSTLSIWRAVSVQHTVRILGSGRSCGRRRWVGHVRHGRRGLHITPGLTPHCCTPLPSWPT